MKIIHLVLGKANPNRMNGVNKVVNSLATYQSLQGYAVSVWGISTNLENNYPDRSYTTEIFQAQKNKLKLSPQLSKQLATIDNNTIVHIHGGFIPEFYHSAKILATNKIPYVFTPHGAYNTKAMEKNKWIKRVYFFLFDKYVAKNASTIHCIGQSEVTSTQKLIKNANCTLIPNGQNVEELKYKPIALKKMSPPVFGFCGRIDIHTKGLDYLLKGFALFYKSTQAGELWIIGESNELSQLKMLAMELNIIDQVTFFGKKFGEEKLNLMAQMDVFFHPSRNEGLPGAVLEAAGLSVPCVVSPESNMAEYINTYKAGIGMSENNEKQVELAMHTLFRCLQDDTFTEFKKNAVQMIEKEFNWNTIAQQLIETYQQAFENNHVNA